MCRSVAIIEHLKDLRLRTRHIRPSMRNFTLDCMGMTAHNSIETMAMRGYLGINVRQYFYIQHRIALRHPYLPCLITVGGRGHRDFWPLEVVDVLLD